jgi:cytoskeletal protein CcmA (bactofilin family)
MFNGRSKAEFASETGGSSTSLIGAGTILKGDLECNGDLRIDGKLVGNIRSTAKVVIGANGVVEGDIVGIQADIMGTVTGNLQVKELLQLKSSAIVNGNISAGKLQIEPAATFNGGCKMEKTVASSKPNNESQKATAA